MAMRTLVRALHSDRCRWIRACKINIGEVGLARGARARMPSAPRRRRSSHAYGHSYSRRLSARQCGKTPASSRAPPSPMRFDSRLRNRAPMHGKLCENCLHTPRLHALGTSRTQACSSTHTVAALPPVSMRRFHRCCSTGGCKTW